MKIGVLAVQGAFIEHEHIIEKIGHEVVEIRQKKDLEGIDGIILPGGESTVQGQLLRKLDMLDTIKSAIADGLPTLATCAGLILLAGHIDNDNSIHIGTLPVTVKRNAYGRQLGSFVRTAAMKGFDEFPMTFIRAPYISSVIMLMFLQLLITELLLFNIITRLVLHFTPNFQVTQEFMSILYHSVKNNLNYNI